MDLEKLVEEVAKVVAEIEDSERFNRAGMLESEGRAAEEKGEIEKAIECYSRAAMLAAKMREEQQHIARMANSGAKLCRKQGQVKLAVELYKLALQPKKIAEMACEAEKSGEIEKALELFEEAGRCPYDRRNAMAYYRIYYKHAALMAEKLGYIERAIIDYAMFGREDYDCRPAAGLAIRELGHEGAIQIAEKIPDEVRRQMYLEDLANCEKELKENEKYRLALERANAGRY